MRFKVVSMQFDQAGQQKVSSAINAAFGGRAFADLDDGAVVRNNVTVFQHPVGEHHACVLKDEGSSRLHRQAAAEN
jgi:hypothetical protein